MKKSFYALFMLFALLASVESKAQDKTVLYSADYNQIATDWTQEGDLVQDLWSLQTGLYAAYGFNATEPITNWLVSPAITLKSDNEVNFTHVVYNSLFGDVTQEAQFVIRETGGEWVVIEGVHYPSGYDPENSGSLVIPESFNGKEVQFAFQYKTTAEHIGLWGIADIEVSGAEGAVDPDPQPEPDMDVIYTANFNQIGETWTEEGDIVQDLWSLQYNCYAAYAFNATEPVTNWLVSPVITLGVKNNVDFNHIAYNSLFGDVTKEAQFVVREVGGEWVVIEGVHYPSGYDPENSGVLAIPENFDGKDVQFGFQYKTTAENTGLWGIVDITVRGAAVPTGIENVNSSEVKNNVIYDLQGRRVNNPNKGIYIVNGKKVVFK